MLTRRYVYARARGGRACRPGVINFVPGDAADDHRTRVLAHRDLAGVHFTGSTAVLQQHVAARSARTSSRYRSYPRIVGETGGKDFIVAHPSADPDGARGRRSTRGAFEYQGQKCSAASRIYVAAVGVAGSARSLRRR